MTPHDYNCFLRSGDASSLGTVAHPDRRCFVKQEEQTLFSCDTSIKDAQSRSFVTMPRTLPDCLAVPDLERSNQVCVEDPGTWSEMTIEDE